MELTAPAGNFESLMAAIKAGANSVYNDEVYKHV